MDLIERQKAIDALDVLCQEHRYRIPGKRETYSEYNEAWQDALDRAEGAICNLPSAQPEPIKVSVDHEMTEEELKELKKKIADSPVILLPSAQPERKTEDFEKGLHDMFDQIWNCEIEHPIFQDTVGELMQAVIQLYRRVIQPCEEGEQDG